MENIEQEYKWQAANKADLQKVKNFLRPLQIKQNLVNQFILDSYYDDAQKTLTASKMAVRLRTINSDFEFTVKGYGQIQNGLVQRQEDTLKITAAGYKKAMSQFRGIFHRLWPELGRPVQLFSIKNHRELIEIVGDGFKAELCLDSCDIILPGKTLKFYEVELEYKKGEPEAFASFAADLSAATGLEYAQISKVATAMANLC